jgi:protoporphyrinogen/coproporphyrinogen III oxidase
MPQYTMGHLDRVDELEARTAKVGGLRLAGGSYRGVGVPNCLDSGERAVRELLGEWGIELAEDQVQEKRPH